MSHLLNRTVKNKLSADARCCSCFSDANTSIRFGAVGPLSWIRNDWGVASPVDVKLSGNRISLTDCGSGGCTPRFCRRIRRRIVSFFTIADRASDDACCSAFAMTLVGRVPGAAVTATRMFAETFAASTAALFGAWQCPAVAWGSFNCYRQHIYLYIYLPRIFWIQPEQLLVWKEYRPTTNRLPILGQACRILSWI